jgi:hypothetical protein
MTNPLRKLPKNHGAAKTSTPSETSCEDEGRFGFQAVPSHKPSYWLNRPNLKNSFTGRPALLEDMLPFLKPRLSCQAQRTSYSDVGALRSFWRFLDTLPNGAAPERLADVDELVGGLFLRYERDRENYAKVRLIVDGARQVANLSQVFWPSPRRRVTRQAGPVCQIGMRRLHHALKAEAVAILKHRAFGAKLAAGGSDPGPPGSPAWHVLANQAWALQRNSPFTPNISIDVAALDARSPIPRPGTILEGKDQRPFAAKMALFYPNKLQTAVFYLLFTMHAGWNTDTVDNMNVAEEQFWLSNHTNDPRLAIVKSAKYRPEARQQIALSLRKPQFHMVGIIKRIIEMTGDLRLAVSRQLASAEASFIDSPSDLSLQRKIELLRQRVKSPWIFITNYARVGLDDFHRKNWIITTLTPSIGNNILRLLIARYDVRDVSGKLLDLTLRDLRDAWIGYAYHKSGYSWLIAKLAAGHASSNALQHYLRQNRWRADGERRYLQLQEAIWHEIRHRRVIDAVILRFMVDRGEITDDQRSRWEAYKDRSRMGMGCRNPSAPPDRLVPNHVAGTTCVFQRCVLCVHGILFSDSLQRGLAQRHAELMFFRETMPVTAWLQSSWPDELEALAQNLKNYDTNMVKELTDYWLQKLRDGRAYAFDQEGS